MRSGKFNDIYSEVLDSKKRKKVLRLTGKGINKLQNYFGIAIRDSNAKTVYELKKGYCSVNKRHQFCLTIGTTWCKHQLDIIKGFM